MAFAAAEFVDGEAAMRAARRVKTAEEIDAIRNAIGVAEAGLAAAVAELRPGVREGELTGVFMEAMAQRGVTSPANQDTVWVTSRTHPWRQVDGEGRVGAGDLVAFAAGVLAGGYTGEVGRMWLAAKTAAAVPHGPCTGGGTSCGPSWSLRAGRARQGVTSSCSPPVHVGGPNRPSAPRCSRGQR